MHALSVPLASRAQRHSKLSRALIAQLGNTPWAVKLNAQFVTVAKSQIGTRLLQHRVLHALVATAPTLMALHANLARELSTASPANAKSVLRLT